MTSSSKPDVHQKFAELRQLMTSTPADKLWEELTNKIFWFRHGERKLAASHAQNHLMELAIDWYNACRLSKQSNDLSLIKHHVDKGVDLEQWDERHSKTPLMFAAYYGELELVEYLVQQGADLAPQRALQQGKRGHWSPLYCAALAVNEPIFDFLLEAGADPSVLNNMSWGDNAPMLEAAVEGPLSMVQKLLRLGVDVDQGKSTDYGSPIIRAAEDYQWDIVRVLAKAGADLTEYKPYPVDPVRIEPHDTYGFDVLDFAIDEREPEIVALLLELGMRVRPEQIQFAEKKGHQQIIELLSESHLRQTE